MKEQESLLVDCTLIVVDINKNLTNQLDNLRNLTIVNAFAALQLIIERNYGEGTIIIALEIIITIKFFLW
jgi:hypothetical protein